MAGADAVYTPDGELFVPSRAAAGPWNPDLQHGGPPSGLLARALERHCEDPDLQLVRLTVDLFRPLPLEPVSVRASVVREGRRVALLQASLYVDDEETTRATGLFLRRSHTPALSHAASRPRGPAGIETTSLVPPELREAVPVGFHTAVEARWSRGADAPHPAVWLRMPLPLVAGEETSATARAAALSDFANALGNSLSRRHEPGIAFVNTDTTLYLSRPPRGEWLCLETGFLSDRDGVGFVEVVQHDSEGRYGCSVQARLANPPRVDRR